MKYFLSWAVALSIYGGLAGAEGVRLATFQADVTPPLGAPLCGGAVKPAEKIDDPLGARGLVLLVEGQAPIVLFAVDWVGIANSGWDTWREALAGAAGTSAERVAVQTLHQHDAPSCDFDTEALLDAQGLGGTTFDVVFAREAIQRTADAVKACLAQATPVTAVGFGQARVDQVASNRRVLGADGKVEHVRWTATKDPAVRARGVGTIDPNVKVISFWNESKPLAVLSYYATHPQSHYGQGCVSADFVGMARSLREQALRGVPHIHFNGAGGNISAGKYNDGAPENRPVLARRLAEGMRRAWEATERMPLGPSDVGWIVARVSMPVRTEVSLEHEEQVLRDVNAPSAAREQAANEVAWIKRAEQGDETCLSALRLGSVYVLHMPGELFVEYQLAAQSMRPEAFVAMAAYGDYGPGYIGTAEAYPQGGYETGVYVSRTAPEVEEVLMAGMRKLLE
ncbi:MAG: hypothetical protein HYV26_21960 [Candidatus Hydrogenedentes bacterium]|nr:hypothetical protein [Candidatus Hydrogenedentota bacterium]